LVLGSGGVRSIAALGIAEVLASEGIRPDLIGSPKLRSPGLNMSFPSAAWCLRISSTGIPSVNPAAMIHPVDVPPIRS
jgi:hypothetical protein